MEFKNTFLILTGIAIWILVWYWFGAFK